MSCPEYSVFARISKVYGNKGEVVAHFVHGFSFTPTSKQELYCIPPMLHRPRVLHVQAATCAADGLVLSCAELDSRSMAESYVGTYLAINRCDLTDEQAKQSIEPLLNKAVHDKRFGDLGVVSEVLRSSAQDTLLVHGRSSDVMIPLVPEFVDDITADTDVITTHIPQSLLDLQSRL